jgi:glycosyltransferase involved in cell wall biosynthesis
MISKKERQIYKINGIAADEVIYNQTAFPRRNYSSSKKFRFDLIFVGRLTPGKGVDLLFQTLKELKHEGIHLRVAFVGEGLLKDSLQNYFQANGPVKILIMGQKNYKETRNLISSSKMLVAPAHWEEPFGRVIIEALSLTTPVIVSNRGGLPELVENGKTGYVVEPNNTSLKKAIRKMLKLHLTFRKNIVQKKRDLYKKFSISPAFQYIQIYQKLLNQRAHN